jgi:hypothetical protein
MPQPELRFHKHGEVVDEDTARLYQQAAEDIGDIALQITGAGEQYKHLDDESDPKPLVGTLATGEAYVEILGKPQSVQSFHDRIRELEQLSEEQAA